MKTKLFAVFFPAFVLLTGAVFAATNEVNGAHLENELQCADCHYTGEPVKKASAKACKDCHGDMLDAPNVKFKDGSGKRYDLSPHNSHAGVLRCTLCHSTHNKSELYCNSCHKDFELNVP